VDGLDGQKAAKATVEGLGRFECGVGEIGAVLWDMRLDATVMAGSRNSRLQSQGRSIDVRLKRVTTM
jgi:hypothetical protein